MSGFFDRVRGGLSPNTPTGLSLGSLMGAVIACFNENGWKFRKGEQANVLQFGFTGKNANYEGVVVVEEDPETFSCFCAHQTRCRRADAWLLPTFSRAPTTE